MTWRSGTAALCALVLLVPASARAVPAGTGDAIFAVRGGGSLDPVAVRVHGAFLAPGSNDGGPPAGLRAAASAALASAGNRVHVVFGGRTVATVPVEVANGTAAIAVPPPLHLGGYVGALASPTLGGHAGSPRRTPTAAERGAALALAAQALGGAPAALTVRNLTAIDLGHGMALVGTIDRRGGGAQHIDRRLFLVAEPGTGRLRTALANVLTVRAGEPLLAESGELLVDAIDLGDGTLSLVTNQIGFDANTYHIYSRAGHGWKPVYTGGGAAL